MTDPYGCAFPEQAYGTCLLYVAKSAIGIRPFLEDMGKMGITSQASLAPEGRAGEIQAGKEPERNSAV
jgi:hypothetical protein